MKSRLIIVFLASFIIGGGALLNSCKKTDQLTHQYFVVPPGFPPPVYRFQDNDITEEGFLLGRKLFFEPRLSIDSSVFCGSCHQPLAAFTTFEHDRSHGVHHNHTLRNAPGLFNLAWYPVFSQDGRTSDLQVIYREHISSPIEMGETMKGVIDRLKSDTAYKKMFRAAFGSEEISEAKIFRAITQFVINLVSANSKYDRVMQGKSSFTAGELNGYRLFQDKCASCHPPPLFTDFSFRNVGLPVDPLLNDAGRMRVTGKSSDSLKFRVPSLRNVELTSYYTHDGRLSLMRHMIQHYRTGVVQSATLDPQLANGIPMTNADEDNLVAFLRTLSDSGFLNNPRYRQ